jgi:hypothetical protein
MLPHASRSRPHGRLMDNMLYHLLIRVRPLEVCLHTASLGLSTLCDQCQWLQTWHYRLCHINHDAVRQLANSNLVNGLQLSSTSGDNFYEGYVHGKQHRLPFPVNNPRPRAALPGQLIHMDICGPMSEHSIGAYYFAAFKDDCTSYRTIHCLVHKSDVQSSIQKVVHQIKRETGHLVETIQSDYGKEFTSKETDQFLQENNIWKELTVPYCPEQNGITERENRMLVEAARSMLHFRNILFNFGTKPYKTPPTHLITLIAGFTSTQHHTRAASDKSPQSLTCGFSAVTLIFMSLRSDAGNSTLRLTLACFSATPTRAKHIAFGIGLPNANPSQETCCSTRTPHPSCQQHQQQCLFPCYFPRSKP